MAYPVVCPIGAQWRRLARTDDNVPNDASGLADVALRTRQLACPWWLFVSP